MRSWGGRRWASSSKVASGGAGCTTVALRRGREGLGAGAATGSLNKGDCNGGDGGMVRVERDVARLIGMDSMDYVIAVWTIAAVMHRGDGTTGDHKMAVQVRG